jgi:hypothetical protein
MRNIFLNGIRGVTSLEVVIGVSIAGIIIAYSANAITQFLNSARTVATETQALYLAEEGLELLRYVRDNDWDDIDSLSLSTPHYFDIASATIGTTATPEVIGDFTRSFILTNVYRDTSTDDIVASTTGGSAADPDSKYVMVSVGWGTGGENVSLTTILTNIAP